MRLLGNMCLILGIIEILNDIYGDTLLFTVAIGVILNIIATLKNKK